MFFFIDESWQNINGIRVGALGAVVIPVTQYNTFCSRVYRLKREVLGATELVESELKGQHMFSKASFKRDALHGDSHWLHAADRLFTVMESTEVQAFVIWTTNPTLLDLRTSTTTVLSKPYRQLLFDMRAYMQRRASRRLGHLNFDQRHYQQDAAAACSIQNFMVRTGGGWPQHFVQIPSFTASQASPGIQAADVTAYLGCHVGDPTARPELRPYVDRLAALRFQFKRGRRTVRSIRRVL